MYYISLPIVIKLERCMVKDIGYINAAAFTDRIFNFRINSISDFWGHVGIKSYGNKIKRYPLFKKNI
jgi:hypothetical protein